MNNPSVVLDNIMSHITPNQNEILTKIQMRLEDVAVGARGVVVALYKPMWSTKTRIITILPDGDVTRYECMKG